MGPNQNSSEVELEEAFYRIAEMKSIELAGHEIGRILNLFRAINNSQRASALLAAKALAKEATIEEFSKLFEYIEYNDSILNGIVLSISSDNKRHE